MSFGKQFKFYGKQRMQINAIDGVNKLPTLQLEISNESEGWDTKAIYQIDPLTQLTDVCLLLMKWSKESSIQLKHSQVNAKTLSLNFNENGSLFVGIVENNESNSKFKILDIHQQFSFKSIALSQLAKVYDCSVTDILNLLKTHFKPQN